MHDVYRDEDCMKKFCESLREQAMRIIKFEKKNIWHCNQTNLRNGMKIRTLVTRINLS